MKKISIFLLTILLGLFILPSCNNSDDNDLNNDKNEHICSFSGDYKSNSTKHWQVCSCGKKSPEENHKFGDWNIIKEATTSTEGLEERVCSVCEYKETQSISVKQEEHICSFTSYGKTETMHWQICSCGKKTEEVNHSFGQWVIIIEPTFTEEGTKERTCICGAKQTESIQVLEHTRGLQYELNAGGTSYSVIGIGTAIDSEIYVLSSYNNLPVVSIEDFAFSSCNNITSIIIPDSVTSIGDFAFSNCADLKNIVVPYSVVNLGEYVFGGCSNLTNVYYEGTLEDWCNLSFSSTSSNPMSYASHFHLKNSINEWEEVTSVEIPNTIKKIGDFQFYGFNNVATIIVPESVQSIGLSVFTACSKVTSITIPFVGANIDQTNNTYLGYLFGADSLSFNSKYVPTSLKEVTIKGGNSIGTAAFSECYYIEKITIPHSVTSIEGYAFDFCERLTSVYYEGTLVDWCKMQLGSTSSNPMEYASHFYLRNNNNEWEDLKSLEEIIIPNEITAIGQYAFSYCSNLKNITIPDSVTSIGQHAFFECSSLISAILPKDLTTIENYLFFNCSNLTDIIIPVNVTGIGTSAFYGCSSFTDIIIPSSITRIGTTAFSGCSSLTNTYYEGTLLDWCKIQSNSTPMLYASHFYLRNSENEWEEATNIEEVIIPDTITEIGNYALYGFNGIKSLTIPFVGQSITEKRNTHFGCIFGAEGSTGFTHYSSTGIPSSLKEVIVTGGERIPNNAFWGCESVESIILPSGIPSIGEDTFYSCSNLTSITFPASITAIDSSAFHWSDNITNIYYEGTIEDWCNISLNNSIFSSNSNHFYLRNSNNEWEEITSIDIPNTITEIGNYRFKRFNNVTSIAIPDSVTSIGNSAFYGCSNLAQIIIPVNVTSIGNSAFYGCSNLTNITIPDNITNIGTSAFSNCSSLESIIIPSGITDIGYNTFYFCSNLTSITLPASITAIDSSAFLCSYKITNIFYEGTIEDWCNISLNDSIFSSNSNHFYLRNSNNEWEEVTSIEIPNTITEIGNYQFNRFNTITSITIPDSVTSIGNKAFSNCSSLESIILPSGITSIGKDTFSYCSNLTSITLPASITTIDSSAFYWSDKITSIFYEGTIEDWCNISLNNSIFSFNSNHFYLRNSNNEWEEVTSIEIPNTITEIGNYQFNRFNTITSVIIPDSVTSIGRSAFDSCKKLKSIIIPASVTSIESYAFDNCNKLVINCEANSKPSNWSSYWAREDYNSIIVNWGYKE